MMNGLLCNDNSVSCLQAILRERDKYMLIGFVWLGVCVYVCVCVCVYVCGLV